MRAGGSSMSHDHARASSRVGRSELAGFYRLSLAERRLVLSKLLSEAGLGGADLSEGLALEHADRMVENAIGVFGVPLGLCLNLRVDGRDRIVPMAIEEPSVIAAASAAAKLLRDGEGIVSIVAP